KKLLFCDGEFDGRFEDLRFAGMVEAEDDGAVGGDGGAVAAAVLNGFDLDDEGTVFLPAFRFRRIQLDDVREIFSFPGFLGNFDRQIGQFDLAKCGTIALKDDERSSALPKKRG